MKRLLLILILTFSFQTLAKADDIRDFEIEGMSIGDSLLDYFTEQEIKDNIRNYYTDDKFIPAEFIKMSFFKEYTNVGTAFKKNDKKYILQSLSGIIFYSDINDCYKKQNEIDKQFVNLLKNFDRIKDNDYHDADPSGNSTTKAIRYWSTKDDQITIICTDWTNDLTNKYGWSDNLAVEFTPKFFNEWLVKKAFK